MQAVVTLRRQYRMNEDIMSLSNALVYSGAMRCGSEQVARARLHLPRYHGLLSVGVPGGETVVPRHHDDELPAWMLQVSNRKVQETYRG